MRYPSALLTALWLLASPLLTNGATLRAQASPYVPVTHWATPYLEYLIARRAIRDPSPLRRPFVQADAIHELAAADTTRLDGAARRMVRIILEELRGKRSATDW